MRAGGDRRLLPVYIYMRMSIRISESIPFAALAAKQTPMTRLRTKQRANNGKRRL